MTTQTPDMKTISTPATLYMALELSQRDWKIGFSDGSSRSLRRRSVPSGAIAAVVAEIDAAKKKFGLRRDAAVKSVYEAGRDGFWIHRALVAHGVENVVIDPTSLQIDRRARHAKTDRLDLEKLVVGRVRHDRGESVWRTVRIPTEVDEDKRRMHRERERLLKEKIALSNRMRGLLATHGVEIRSCLGLIAQLDSLRRYDGSPLPGAVRAELQRMSERWDLARKQIRELEAEVTNELADGSKASQQALQLQLLCGVGPSSALVLTKEIFAWREIKNRRQLGALAGMVGVPYSSGHSHRDQGISKAGSRRIRSLMVQLAWGWLRYQQKSALSSWFHERFGVGKRLRRVGIVALARKLLIAFWRFVEDGVVPDGAALKPSA